MFLAIITFEISPLRLTAPVPKAFGGARRNDRNDKPDFKSPRYFMDVFTTALMNYADRLASGPNQVFFLPKIIVQRNPLSPHRGPPKESCVRGQWGVLAC